MTHSELKVGTVVVFTVVFSGSYLSEGVPYKVESANKREVYFRRVNGASGTSECRSILARCEFEQDGEAELVNVAVETSGVFAARLAEIL